MSDCVTQPLDLLFSNLKTKITMKEMNSSKKSVLYFGFCFKMNNVITAIRQIKLSFDENQKR